MHTGSEDIFTVNTNKNLINLLILIGMTSVAEQKISYKYLLSQCTYQRWARATFF
jgi:hypothetical protein